MRKKPTGRGRQDPKDDLLRKLESLRKKMRGLGQRLEKAAADMRSKGELLPQDVLRGIQSVEDEWSEIQKGIKAIAARVEESDVLPPLKRNVGSAQKVLAAVDAARERLRLGQILEPAQRLLSELERVSHQDGADAKALDSLRSLIETIKNELEEVKSLDDPGAEELKALSRGVHPANDLLRILKENETLDDHTWRRLSERIENAFGAELATAVARGKLFLSPHGLYPEGENGPGKTEAKGHEPTAPEGKPPSGIQEVASTGASGQSPPKEDDPGLTKPRVSVSKSEYSRGDASEAVLPTSPAKHADEATTEASISPAVPVKRQEEVGVAERALWDLPAKDLAEQILAGEAPEKADQILTWRLIDENQLGLAYHYASVHPPKSHEYVIPPAILKLLAIRPELEPLRGSVSEYARAATEELFSINLSGLSNSADQRAVSLLLLAALLKPALIRSTGAVEALKIFETDGKYTPLHDLKQAIVDYVGRGLSLTPTLMKALNRRIDWNEEGTRLRDDCAKWRTRKRQAKILYAPATGVWRAWLADGGELARILAVVIENKTERVQWLKEKLEYYEDEDRVKELIHRTDQSLRKKTRVRKIEAAALRRLLSAFNEALDWPRRWLYLQDEQTWNSDDFRFIEAKKLRDAVLRSWDNIQEIRSKAEGEEPPYPIAFRSLYLVVEDLANMFVGDAASGRSGLPSDYYLNSGLLKASDVVLDDGWRLQSPKGERLRFSVLQAIKAADRDWADVFEDQLEDNVRNFAGALQALEMLEDSIVDNRRQEYELRWEEELQATRVYFHRRVREVGDLVATAVTDGLLTETEGLQKQRQLENLNIDQALAFEPVEAQIAAIECELNDLRQGRLQELQQRFEKLKRMNISVKVRDRIQEVLDNRDLFLGDMFLHLAENNESLPERQESSTDSIRIFQEFFPKFTRDLNDFMGRTNARDLIDSVERGRNFGPIRLQGIPKDQLRRAARMLRCWFGMKSSRRIEPKRLRDFFETMGFDVTGATKVADRGSAVFDLTIVAIGDRHICPVPRFGSSTRGRYRVVGIWDRFSEDETVDLASRHRGAYPLILLYFGRLSEQRRRDLARLCRNRKHDFLVLDETLVAYLCSTRKDPRQRLFQCALPFTVGEPFATVAGMVAPEMFFGRERERQQVFNPEGTNLVYGGRQLGKTALLKDVVRRFHDPDNGILVRYVDLKAEGIGLNRPLQDLWPVLVETLGFPHTTTQKTFPKQVERWLDEKPAGRILLLLDEADTFLDKDASGNYDHVAALKGLMDRTERRFKVVFAGLHNVQRTSRDVNTPLAHLGTPVCIGPLLEGESREAIDLVRIPFEALGYRFSSSTLPIRIAGLANFYPSLIQLFCQHLIGYLNDPNRVQYDAEKSPPYLITAQHIEEVYNRQELRRAILERFRWTLDLDNRYRVLALIIALESIENRERGGSVDGFPLDWIRDQALGWWPEGFRECSSRESLATMLEEMIGLGILAQSQPGRYTLRSPNVLSILGTREEIESALLDAVEREPQLEYEATTFRRRLSDSKTWLRSPLTAEQEARIFEAEHGVALVFASPLSGVDDLIPALQHACGQGRFQVLESPVSSGLAFAKALDELVDRRKKASRERERKGEVFGILVGPEVPWSGDWVARAIQRTLSMKISSFSVRVIFVGDLGSLWRWLKDRQSLTGEDISNVKEIIAQPWSDAAIRRWMEDSGIGPGDDRNARLTIRNVTGGWTWLMHELGRRCAAKAVSWKEGLENLRLEMTDMINQTNGLGIPPQASDFLGKFTSVAAPLPPDEIGTLAELVGWPEDEVRFVFHWADESSLLTRDEDGRLIVEPVVGRILSGALQS